MSTLGITQDSGHTVSAPHTEAPRTIFIVDFYAQSYCNVLHFRSGRRWMKVLAETAEGGLQIAIFHYGTRGTDFQLLAEPPTRT